MRCSIMVCPTAEKHPSRYSVRVPAKYLEGCRCRSMRCRTLDIGGHHLVPALSLGRHQRRVARGIPELSIVFVAMAITLGHGADDPCGPGDDHGFNLLLYAQPL